jgi:hypothetical protein
MARGRESVEKDDWLTDASRPGGVVVEARAAEIDELTAHVGSGRSGASRSARGRRSCGKMRGPRIRDKRRQMHSGPAMRIAGPLVHR